MGENENMKINLFDTNNINKSPVSGHKFPSQNNIEWVIGSKKFNGMTLFTDKHIVKNTVTLVTSKIKVAWLVEPKIVYNKMYKAIVENEKQYDYILTHDADLLSRNKKYILVPAGGTWIPIPRQQIYAKTKLISSIVSKKNMFPGHKIRHEMCNKIKNIDYYGSKFEWIQTKDIGLKDHMFSVAIENSSVPNYFTEKIIDCFLCGTVPVYWGCKNLGGYFNMNGVIKIKNVSQLKQILPTFNKQKYNQILPAINDNFNRAKNYIVMIDWMYDNILKELK
jgi:hypothetical protein